MMLRAFIPLIASAASAAAGIDFNRDIRPIFTTQCAGCHGGVKEAGGISFVFREKALAIGDSGNPTIVPGNPDASELIARITASDPDDVMPPPDHGRPLPAEDIEKLRQWIAEGAEWSEHWAFVKPAAHPVPTVKRTDWPKNDIDRFILAGLEAAHLEPAAEAEPALLLRRLSLDLVGLPPTLEELDAFEAAHRDDPDAAYATAVDQLLASPHFGERWATTWLDLARYADTEGLGLDRPRTAWPFRDWVIRAYNDDLPFDEFTLRQLAGDLLPEPTVDDLIATNFHRQSQSNAEGGTDDEEFRVAAVMDRVATTWEAWQGVTMGCVQCHSHPYDPIQHEEYYTSTAFFNTTRDADLNGHFPLIPVPNDPAKTADFSRWIRERAGLLEAIHGSNEALREQSDWHPAVALAATSRQVKLEVDPEAAELKTVGTVPSNAEFEITLQPPPGLASLSALRLDVMPQDPATAIHTPEWGAVLSQIELTIGDETVELAAIIPDEPEPFLDPANSLRDNSQGWGIYSKIDRPRVCIVVLREPLTLTPDTRLTLRIRHRHTAGGTFPLVTKRARISLAGEPHWTALPHDAPRAAQTARVAEIDKALAQFSSVRIPVMQEQPPHLRRPTHLFIRGNWLEKDDALHEPGIPGLFGALPEGTGSDRLAFARWLVSADNPLTARVVVNRFWEQLFGIGLVETLEDFGSSGTKPSHPELLDWLALRFRDHHQWSNKAILRDLVTSAAYRQSAATAVPGNRQADPQNQLVARGPRNRLSAEAIRDSGLVTSGLFAPTVGGPPAFPPMPPGGWTPFKSGERWATPDPGQAGRYRRAIYTYTKRSNPYPGFATFDAPARDLCAKRRILSNTPLQALDTLNSPAFAEFAQGLARRMKNDLPGDLAAKIAGGHRIATSRLPSAERLASLTELFKELEELYTADPDLKEGMAGTADGAAFTVLASVLLNLDEALVK